jgi:S-adenosylmethionine hydrolase
MALLTLTTDIGLQDYLAAAIKGQLLQIDPDFRIIDVTHQISPFNYPQAAYLCRNAISNFPGQTFHIVMVNMFERKPDQLLLAFHQNQYILCADNGLLSMILEDRPEIVIGLPTDKNAIRNTIYCAGIFGKAISDIKNGKKLSEIGLPAMDLVEKNPLRPMLSDAWIEGQIIYIDNFENVVVNITREQFESQRKGRRFTIVFKRDEVIEKISETYADVAEGEKLAIFNSANYLEIAINKGNAAGLFGLQGYLEQAQNSYMQNRLFYQTVKIFFQ